MRKINQFIRKWGGAAVAGLALLVGVASVNSACIMWYHQPKVPQGMARFGKGGVYIDR